MILRGIRTEFLPDPIRKKEYSKPGRLSGYVDGSNILASASYGTAKYAQISAGSCRTPWQRARYRCQILRGERIGLELDVLGGHSQPRRHAQSDAASHRLAAFANESRRRFRIRLRQR